LPGLAASRRPGNDATQRSKVDARDKRGHDGRHGLS